MQGMTPPPGGAGGAPPQDMNALIQALMQNPQLAQQMGMGGGAGGPMPPMQGAMPLMGSGPAMMPQPMPYRG